MQVFLPYPDFQRSVRCLDPSRLGNQIYRECKTLIQGKWPNHPVSKMWKGYERLLASYALAGLEELSRRGRNYLHHELFFHDQYHKHPETSYPPWFGDDRLHSSHRRALLYKDFAWYSQFKWEERAAVPYSNGSLSYFWP